MPADDPGEVTALLKRIAEGEAEAAPRLLALLYAELKVLARSHLRGDQAGSTLQPTVLLHEAYLRLLPREGDAFANRRQFFAMASKAMRSVLVDHARRRAVRRREAVPAALCGITVASASTPEELIDLDSALGRLEHIDPQRAKVVELLFFAAMSPAQAADVLGCSSRTVERHWSSARAWLYGQMQRDRD